MSSSAPGRREVAYRLFASEFNDSTLSYSESDEERAPNYVVSPTGARINRLFAVGVLTEIEDVNPEMVRGRLVDPTGAFVTYAGQYQPEALAVLERAEPPAFFALAGKARTYEPDDGDRIFTSVRPESVSEVDAETRDRWVITTAERTLDRIGITAAAIDSGLTGGTLRDALIDAGVDDRLADGITLALDHYGTTPGYLDALRTLAINAVRVVSGDREEVGGLALAPDEGTGDAGSLATIDLSEAASAEQTGPTTESGADSEQQVAASKTPSKATADSTADTGSGSTEQTVEETSESADSDDTEGSNDEAGAAESTAEGVEISDGAETAEPEPESASESEPGLESEPEPETEPPADREADQPESFDEFDPGEFELDETERQAVEDEFGTEFSTADEIESADIEPEGASDDPGTEEISELEAKAERKSETDSPDTDAHTERDEPSQTEPDADTDIQAEPETETEVETAPDSESDAVDLEAAVRETMSELDTGDGADVDALVQTIVEAHGVREAAVEKAIQDALMSGQCYEPADGKLKPI